MIDNDERNAAAGVVQSRHAAVSREGEAQCKASKQHSRGRSMHRHEANERLIAFVRESNRIEGIHRLPTDEEIKAHRTLVARKRVKIEHVTKLVAVCQPNAVLRATTDVPGVRVGNHVAPPSGPKIIERFELLLKRIANDAITPWAAHVEYETLHPYTDGNGRSGRAVWLWHMTVKGQQSRALAIGFLHTFYYQTLAASH